jgi:hypothetical protein
MTEQLKNIDVAPLIKMIKEHNKLLFNRDSNFIQKLSIMKRAHFTKGNMKI